MIEQESKNIQYDEVTYENEGNPKYNDLQPEWKNPPTVNQLEQDVKEAQPDFDTHVNDVSKWLDIRDAKLKVKIPKGQSRMSPKLVRKQNEWRYAALSEPFLSSEDMYDVDPQTYQDEDSARDNAIVINKQFEVDIDRVKFIDEYVRTAVDEGTVFVRVGWDYEEEETTYLQPIQKKVYPPEVQAQIQQAYQAVQMGQMDPMAFQQMMVQAEQQAVIVDTDEFEEITEVIVKSNKPTLDVCDYDRVMLDPTCEGDMEKAQFIVYQFISSKAELREDPKYSNVDKIVFENGTDNVLNYADEDIINSSFQFKDEPRKKLVVTEYWGEWDIHNDGTTIPIVATYVGKVMIRREENPFPDKKPPFVKVNYLPKRRDVYGGEPDAVLIEEHQDVIGAVTRGMIDLMGKSANAQQGVSANALDTAQKLRFEQGKDFIFNPDVDPSKAFWMATYPEIPQSAMQLIDMNVKDAEEMTSIVPFSAAKQPGLGSTASAVRSATDATAKREMGIIRRLSNGLIEIGKKIIAMNQVNLSDEEIIRMTDGQWVNIKRENLAGKFDLRISVSTPEADQEQAQDLGFMLQTIGPNMDPGLQAKILGKIARLKKMPGLAHDIETYKPEPDPAQEKIKMLQIQLLEAQLENERAKGTENQADTVLKYAKAETEKAKSRNLNSNSDNQDLEFLQEQAGVKHQRELDKQAQKFDSDIGKEAVKSMLDKDTGTIDSDQLAGNKPIRPIPDITPINPSSGSLPVEPLPDMTGRDELLGMNTPEQNLEDQVNPKK